ncbi:MAG: SurA N-terminal domain-containing protein, partial [Deltaproteobacteria bacterium]|nr:SurA N-terminal domain-containing protein [Deltaproteobacteria bacterium]
MLDLMRRHARSWLIKVALGGVIIVFIFFFGWGGVGERTQDFAATVNGQVISRGEFVSTFESEMAKIRLRYKGSIPQELMDKFNLKEQVLNSLVDQTLLVQEAERLGMMVTDKDLINDIQSDRLFQRNGIFDPSIYKQYLAEIKMSPQLFEDVHRRQMLVFQLVRLITDSVKTDPEEMKKLWHFQNDKIVLSCLFIRPEPESGTPSQEALESYFKKNQANYEIPATVSLKYVVISWRDAAKKVSVTDDEARSYYENNPKEFLVPERVRARHILLEVPEGADKAKKEEVLSKAKELLARIKGGEKFDEAAKAESQDQSTAPKGGDLG